MPLALKNETSATYEGQNNKQHVNYRRITVAMINKKNNSEVAISGKEGG